LSLAAPIGHAEPVSATRKLGRVGAFPLLRLIEPRFADLVRRLTDTRQAVAREGEATREAVASYAESSGESLTFVGGQLRELRDEVRGLAAAGAAAPEPGGADLLVQAYAVRALAGVSPPARVLDVGGAASGLARALAALGFRVTGADPRPYAHAHPNLETVASPAGLAADEPFAAACCLGALDAGAADAADPWAAERAALTQIGELVAAAAPVVLALPLGERVQNGRAHYDEARLGALLEDWQVSDRVHAAQPWPGEWAATEGPEGAALVLVTATRA
jgi:hypothetical protein